MGTREPIADDDLEALHRMTKREFLVALLAGEYEEHETDAPRHVALTQRMSPFLLARIDAYAGELGRSRNFVINHFCEVAMETISVELPQKVRRSIAKRETEAMTALAERIQGGK